jgi:4-amino-4-deoxy-L-arabinose transferase-like glycosyltransferase
MGLFSKCFRSLRSTVVALCSSVRPKASALTAVIALGTALRLALFVWTCYQSPDLSTLHYSDTISYVEPAESLLDEGRFASHGQPELFRTPGYSLLLLPGIALQHVELVTFFIQLILSVATIWLVYGIALDLFGDSRAALGAALLMAVEPLAIIFTSALLSETLFTFVFVLFLRYFLRYLSSHKVVDLAVCGLLLAAATFVRPVTYYLPAALVVGLSARALWLGQPRLRLIHCGVFAVASVVPLAAWQMRNARVADYSAFSASADFNLYYHHAAWAIAQHRGQTLGSVQDEFGIRDDNAFDATHPDLRSASRAQRFAFMGLEGKRLVRQYFPEWVKVQIRNVMMIALNPGGTSFLQLATTTPVPRPQRLASAGVLATVRQMAAETPILFFASLVLGAVVGCMYLLSFLGWSASLKRRPWEMAVLLGITGYFVATSAAVVEARLRHPVMPMLCLLGGAGIVVLQHAIASLSARYANAQAAALVLYGRISQISCDRDASSPRPFAGLEIVSQAYPARSGLTPAKRGVLTRLATAAKRLPPTADNRRSSMG